MFGEYILRKTFPYIEKILNIFPGRFKAVYLKLEHMFLSPK